MYSLNLLFVSLCFLVIIVSTFWTVIRILKYKKFDLIDIFIISIAFYNGVVLNFIYFTIQGDSKYLALNRILDIDSFAWLYPAYSLIALFFVWFGGSLATKKEVINNVCKTNSDLIKLPCVMYVSTFSLVMAIFSYWIYVLPYGGFIKYLDYSFIIRAGLFNEVLEIDRSFSFLRRFGSFSFFSTLLFFGIYLNYKKNNCKRKHILILLITSFIFSIYVLYSWGGRLAFIKLLLSLLIGYYLFFYGRTLKFTSKIMIPFMVVIIFLPFSGKIWSKNKGGNEFSTFIVNELSYPVFALNESIRSGEYHYFKDLLVMPLFMFPERIWSGILNIDTVSQVNTERIIGVKKGVRESTITVPVDFISFGVIQGGVFGVFLLSFLAGYVIKKLDYYLINNIPPGCMEMIYAYIALNFPVQLVLYSDPKHVIYRNFSMICGLIILALFCRPKSRCV